MPQICKWENEPRAVEFLVPGYQRVNSQGWSAALIVVLRLSQGYSWEKGDRMLLAREGGRAGSWTFQKEMQEKQGQVPVRMGQRRSFCLQIQLDAEPALPYKPRNMSSRHLPNRHMPKSETISWIILLFFLFFFKFPTVYFDHIFPLPLTSPRSIPLPYQPNFMSFFFKPH